MIPSTAVASATVLMTTDLSPSRRRFVLGGVDVTSLSRRAEASRAVQWLEIAPAGKRGRACVLHLVDCEAGCVSVDVMLQTNQSEHGFVEDWARTASAGDSVCIAGLSPAT